MVSVDVKHHGNGTLAPLTVVVVVVMGGGGGGCRRSRRHLEDGSGPGMTTLWNTLTQEIRFSLSASSFELGT